jgi:1,2-diacylglycerol 3-beta-galactosyltransferase
MTLARQSLHAVVKRTSRRAPRISTVSDGREDVVVFYMDAGGGHRAALHALDAAALETRAPLRLLPLSLQEVLVPLDFTRRLTGVSLEQLYNAMVRRGFTRHLVPLLRTLHGLTRLNHRTLVRLLADELRRHRPAAVLSVAPNFNAAIRDAVRATHPAIPFLVLLTDLADFPPHFWMEPGIDRVIVATEHAARQAVAQGIPRARVTLTTGMPLHPRFYPPPGPEARARVRDELGFASDDRVALLLFGGKGAPEVETLAGALLASPAGFRVIAVCGDNPALHERMARIESRGCGRLRRFAFTDRVAELMAAADVLVTKPGPGTLAEAFHNRLPAVVVSNGRTIPQERFNARHVQEQGLGLVVRHLDEVPAAVSALTGDPLLVGRTRAKLAGLPENRAVFEALAILTSAVAGV